MRNIADIIADDKNGKQLSQTERQVAVAYAQGKYDAVTELKLVNDSNAMDTLDKIRAEIEEYRSTIDNAISEDEFKIEGMKEAYIDCLEIINKYKDQAESEEKR